ncbi:aromatic ring-hydroxylating oxygenase subunit alpha [Actinopolyspora mortivallis]|uniref:aromatic ring-hydroxylating oxygenase subunit alpha n=1 Tax=Actinopolyspora mortivallis TaxID=33906 RepID=UPI0009FBEDCA|nr:aromatic ring-hydroxylating dioxygenase subunit alpha [Actinopolyspora mortivallis]
MTELTSVGQSTVEPEPDGLTEKALLSARTYSDPEFLELEKRYIFGRTWQFVEFCHNLANPGDVRPVEVNGQPIILLRDSNGELKAFHNVCSHRGSQLVCEPAQNRKTLVCPYHAWIYDLDGKLFRARHFAGVDQSQIPTTPEEEISLKPVKVAAWLDFIFVNLDDQAVPFAQVIEPLEQRWADYDFRDITYSTSLRYDFQANWKLIVENFLESYHVPFIHQTLNTYSPFVERYQISISDEMRGIGQGTYQPQYNDGIELPRWPIRSGATAKAEYFNIFPSFFVGVMPDHFFAWSLEIQSPTRTVEHLHFYFCGEEAAHDPRYEGCRKTTLNNWKQVNDEDWDIIQRMQSGMRSSSFERALMSHKMERNINGFQQRVLGAVGHDHTYGSEGDR